MKEAVIEVKEALQDLNISKPIVPLIANVTANITDNPQDIKELLIKQVTGSVRWRETILFMNKNNIKRTIEIGSGKVLSGLVTRTCNIIDTVSIQNVDNIKKFVE